MARTGAGGSDEDGAELLCWRLGPLDGVRFSLLEHLNLFVQLRNEAFEVLELVGRRHSVSEGEKWAKGKEEEENDVVEVLV